MPKRTPQTIFPASHSAQGPPNAAKLSEEIRVVIDATNEAEGKLRDYVRSLRVERKRRRNERDDRD